MFRKLLAITCAATLLPAATEAAPFNNATIRRIIDGREVFIDRQEASVDDSAARGQELSTGSSRAEVLFDRRALGFLGNNSLIRLGEDCFRLNRGQVLINGPQNSCLGTKVLGIRGTTYVLSVLDDGNYELAVLSGEATVGDGNEPPANESSPDILSMYPTLNPVIGLGSRAWASSSTNKPFDDATGLVLGEASLFLPLSQSQGSKLLYNYSSVSSNFDGAWGAGTELGYKWFSPDDRSTRSLLVGYDGWDSAGCFHSQLAVGGLWQREGWQVGMTGGIPLDQCVNNLGYASSQVGIPLASLGTQAITLSLSPYVLHGIGDSYGGGRIGLNVPISDQLTLSAYAQHDKLLNTMVGGRVNFRFAANGDFVNDPNRRPQEALSSMTAQADELGVDRPMPISPSQDHDPEIAATASEPPRIATTKLSNLISTSEAIVRLQAGEQATFTPDGVLLSRQAMSQQKFSQLIIDTMSGQNLLPESHLINLTFQELFGRPDQTLLSVLGSDWRVTARAPYVRRRGSDNFVVPEDKLLRNDEKNAAKPANETRNEEADEPKPKEDQQAEPRIVRTIIGGTLPCPTTLSDQPQ